MSDAQLVIESLPSQSLAPPTAVAVEREAFARRWELVDAADMRAGRLPKLPLLSGVSQLQLEQAARLLKSPLDGNRSCQMIRSFLTRMTGGQPLTVRQALTLDDMAHSFRASIGGCWASPPCPRCLGLTKFVREVVDQPFSAPAPASQGWRIGGDHDLLVRWAIVGRPLPPAIAADIGKVIAQVARRRVAELVVEAMLDERFPRRRMTMAARSSRRNFAASLIEPMAKNIEVVAYAQAHKADCWIARTPSGDLYLRVRQSPLPGAAHGSWFTRLLSPTSTCSRCRPGRGRDPDHTCDQLIAELLGAIASAPRDGRAAALDVAHDYFEGRGLAFPPGARWFL